MDDVEMIACHSCGELLPHTRAHFYWKNFKLRRLDPSCIKCRNQRERMYQETDEAKEKRILRMRKKEAKMMGATEGERAIYKVVKDPDELGGFNPGAVIPSSQVSAGLKLGNFTPHTLLKCKGRFFEVLGVLPEHLRELTRSEMSAKTS